ncbi:YceH family protein [Granulicella arctica]|uniref:YceH family protein n=1 Tax=Granulicella arctica TaxID=940613 RepID=UPI0021E0CF60|nr:YceH family protein [Granulicella arctica]
MILGLVPLRVLGALIEKEITTPESYPLSLNALINACNQRSSRDPVLDLDEEQVRQALHTLEDLELATAARDARVPKYEHRARTVFNLRRDETAVLCLLLLRGPQTPGELRSRADRLFTFDDLAAVQSTLDRLGRRELSGADAVDNVTGPLSFLLPRQPGARESRYMHLLGGPPSAEVLAISTPTAQPSRLAELEASLGELRTQIASLETRVAKLESNGEKLGNDSLKN